MRHKSGAVVLLIGAVLLTALPSAATTPDEVVQGVEGGVFVSAGADGIDPQELRALVEKARAGDLDLLVVVLDEDLSAVGFAEQVAAEVGGTVLVFTDAAYGAFSTDLSQEQMDEALGSAAGKLAGSDLVDGVDAFVEAATGGDTSWGLILLGIAALVLVVGLGGRLSERRLSASRRQRALLKQHSELARRADRLADPMIDLSTKVDLSGSRHAAALYREASELYSRVRADLDRPPSPEVVDGVAAQLDDLDGTLQSIGTALASPGEGVPPSSP